MTLYEVVLTTNFGGRLCVNRWNYEGSGTPVGVTGSFGLGIGMGLVDGDSSTLAVDSMLDLIRQLQSSTILWENIVVKAVYDPEDFYAQPFSGALAGSRTGQALPSFNAFGFTTSRVRRDIRRATKRFVGVTEDGQNGGVVDPTVVSTYMEPVATAMSGTLSYTAGGNSLAFVPTICHRERYNPATHLADANGSAYRYYETEELQLQHIAQGFVWSPYDTVRSQASRQIGHGT